MTQSKHKGGAAKHPEEYKCTEANCTFVTRKSLFAKQELGRHLKFAHGIGGRSSSAKVAQERKEMAKSVSEATTAKHELSVIREKRQYTKRSTSLNGYDAQAFITIGYIKYLCEVEAEKLGVPKESFTRRCAELFLASQIGT